MRAERKPLLNGQRIGVGILEENTVKIVQINATCGVGSTGKICVGISQVLTENKIENNILYSSQSNGYKLGIRCSNDKYIKIQALNSRIFGNYGFNSKRATRKILSELERIKPDIVHLHNIHGHDCHFDILLTYLKKRNIKTVWTFHDCWCFTGYCTYFDVACCKKWKTACNDCPQKKTFSFFFDKSTELQNRKKAAFDGLNLTIVTPSKWLASMVKESFLKDVTVRVIYNGIDLDMFKPTENPSISIKKTDNEKIVLGVADVWGYRKGLDVFVELSKSLPENYKIVLVGTDENVDKQLPKNIISIHRTNNQKELAGLYTAADVFVNPTREDNYPTVNMEAIACGTPVITYRTGGSPECIDETSGSVVDCDDIDALEKKIIRICETNPYSKEDCIRHAKAFNQNERFMEYVELYKELL